MDILHILYALLHLLLNFLVPVMKLKENVRTGSQLEPISDEPQTPYSRALDSHHVSEEDKAERREPYSCLDPLSLGRRINHLQDRLLETPSDWKKSSVWSGFDHIFGYILPSGNMGDRG
jgi:hypothetical protein